MKWVMRGLIILVSVATIVVVGVGWYFWSLGGDVITRGKAVGWVAEAESAPLTVFEQTAAKGLFAETWNRKAFPCRTLANGLSGRRTGMTVSVPVALGMQMDVLPEGTLHASVARASAACQLETMHGDAALLRLWLDRFRISRDENVVAGSQRLLGKPLWQLDEAESARMVALLQSPGDWKRPEKWAKRTAYILQQARRYVWVGEQLERVDTATQ
jgi:hypothetical protein